jgi:hypothetical protein
MEDTRFDDMTKALGAPKTRRLTLGVLLGGALHALGLAEAEAAKRRGCKPAPNECQTCKKGKCRKTNNGKKCKKGKLKPKADGTLCSAGTCLTGTCLADGGGGGGGGGTGGCPVCQVRQGGICVNAPAGTACDAPGPGAGKCNGSGTCTPRPNCATKGVMCLVAIADACCSDTCAIESVLQTSGTCAKSGLGQPCITSADCNEGLEILAVCGNDFTCQSVLDI